MKKLIILASTTLGIFFSYQLAHFESQAAEDPMSADQMKSDQMKSDSMSSSHHMKNDRWVTAKSCKDGLGHTFKRGEKGFSTCVKEMRLKESEEMGGRALDKPMDIPPDMNKPDTGTGY